MPEILRTDKVPPSDIRANPENPRKHFPRDVLDELTDSIEEKGILVPLAVYEERLDGEPPYVLIDGECRWQCARDTGVNLVPITVHEKPAPEELILQMFHIHHKRTRWEDMPTTLALKKVVALTGVTEVDRLAEMTGLSTTKVEQYLHALTLPPEYQNLIDSGEIGLNYFIELRDNLLGPLARKRPALLKELGEEAILDAFVQKRKQKVSTSAIELRNLRPIIDTAMKEAGAPDAPSDFDEVIRELVRNPHMTVAEAYENSVEMVVEAGRFATQCEALVTKFDRLISRADPHEVGVVMGAIKRLLNAFQERLSTHRRE